MAFANYQKSLKAAIFGGAGAMAGSAPYPKRTVGYGKGRNYSYVKRRRTQGRSKSFKKMVYDAEPGKHLGGGASTPAMSFGTIYSVIPTQAIVQGSDNTQRRGDQVYLCALKVNGQAITNSAAASYKYRIIVGWTGEEYSASGIATGWSSSGLDGTALFIPGTTAGSVNGVINPKATTVLYDEVIDINSQVSAATDLKSMSFSVPLNQVFNYQAAGSVHGKTRNLYIVVMAIHTTTNAPTDAGKIDLAWDLIFK